MGRKEIHVVKNPNDGWDGKKPDSKRVSCHADIKAEAVIQTRKICINQGAECVIHGMDGKIQGSNSYGRDPCPPKDKKK